jgi:predicted ATPase
MDKLAAGLNEGLGGVIWIEGEPGIGKSRLMAEFSTSMKVKGTRVWSGGCSPQRSGYAFSLFSDLLRRTLNLQSADTPEQVRHRIDQVFSEWPKDAQVTRPYLDILMGMEPSGPTREQIARLTPEQLRQQAFVALRRLFKSIADEEPLIVLLDDLHWIDPMSAELLQFLVKMVTTTPILFVCAQRRQGADSPNDRLVRAQSLIPTQTVRFRLERLSISESEMLLREILPHAALPTELSTAILEQGEGNPYFIEEFVRMLIERGYLEQRQDLWEVDPSVEIGDLPLPSSLEALIRSRIDALPLELKQLLQCAAVVGEPIEVTLLEASCEMSNAGAAIRRLESRLLVCQGAEADQWNFNHSLIQAVAYGTMPKTRRKMLHLRCAQALEARWAGIEAEHADELAYHFSQADEDEKAQMYLMMAAERAAARYANEEAVIYFGQVAKRLVGQPETSVDLRWRVATGLGDVSRSMGKYADSMAILESGLELIETGLLSIEQQAGLYRRLGQTAQRQGELGVAQEYLVAALEILGSPVDRLEQIEAARTLFRLAWIYFYQGRFDQARQTCEDSVKLARRASALSELALSENLLGGIYSSQGNWASALHHTMRAMVLREQAGYTWGVAGSLSNLGILAVSAGHWDKAWSFFERSLVLRQEMGDVEGVAIVRNNLGTLARDRGDLDQAEYHFRQSLAIAEPFEISFHIANSAIGLAQVLLLQGRVAAAEEAITDSLAQAEAIGAEDLLAEIHYVRAKILLAKSVWDEARAEVERAVSLVVETGNRSLEASSWRVASEIELARGNLQAALVELDKSRQALADVTDYLEAGRIAAQAGRIGLHEGQLQLAVADLESAREIFMRLGANLDLRQAEGSLEQALAPKS